MEFYEIDFLPVGDSSSGDAIALRYGDLDQGPHYIHVVDGGYVENGDDVVSHIRKYFRLPNGQIPTHIDHVVVTHPDGDHANGLRKVLEEFSVGTLWMNRPWEFADQLLGAFEYNYTQEGLKRRLRENFPNLAALEEIAIERGVPIQDAFAGTLIGKFVVLAPSQHRFLDLVVNAERTPEPARKKAEAEGLLDELAGMFAKAVEYVSALWGAENLKGGEGATSRENEMSIVQMANLCDRKILLTGDAGVEALTEAYNSARAFNVSLPDLKVFQVPHHGSRRNLNSEILDVWVGKRLQGPIGEPQFLAPISAAKNDEDHPRKAVVRAIHHRGGKPIMTKGLEMQCGWNAPHRDGWGGAEAVPYPNEQED